MKENEGWLVLWQLVLKKLACALYTEILHTDSFCNTGARFHTDSLCCRSWLVNWKLVLGYGLFTDSLSTSEKACSLTVLLEDGLCTDSFCSESACALAASTISSTVTASDALTASTGRWLLYWKKLLLGYGFYWEMARNSLYTGSIY